MPKIIFYSRFLEYCKVRLLNIMELIAADENFIKLIYTKQSKAVFTYSVMKSKNCFIEIRQSGDAYIFYNKIDLKLYQWEEHIFPRDSAISKSENGEKMA